MGRALRAFEGVLGGLGLVLLSAAAHAAPPPPAAAVAPPDTRGVVEIETLGPDELSVLAIEDLATIIDDGATRRVLPVLGKGSSQNAIDLSALRGVDMAVVQTDVMNDALRRGIAAPFTYVARLYDEEFYLLARSDVHSLADLAGRPVNVDVHSSGTRVTAEAVFAAYHVPVRVTAEPMDVAIAQLKRGDIAAAAMVAPKPVLALAMLKREDGLHLLPLPSGGAPLEGYTPVTLTAQDYPELIGQDHPVGTVAVGMALVAANLPPQTDRYRNMASFVDVFFTQYQSLLEPEHLAIWRDVNLAAEIPGWHRFRPAEQWLRRNATTASDASVESLRTTFSRFIDQRQHVLGGAPMSGAQKAELFQKFEQWQSGTR